MKQHGLPPVCLAVGLKPQLLGACPHLCLHTPPWSALFQPVRLHTFPWTTHDGSRIGKEIGASYQLGFYKQE